MSACTVVRSREWLRNSRINKTLGWAMPSKCVVNVLVIFSLKLQLSDGKHLVKALNLGVNFGANF